MNAVILRMKVLHVLLAALLLVEGVPAALAAMPQEESAIENVRYEVSGELVMIYYDLIAPIDKVHSVRLLLKRESDAAFLHRPLNLTGDVGTIVFPGVRRRIMWEFLKEFPEGLTGDDYYFVVEAEATQTERMSPWIWIGGGAAVVGGVLTLLLLGGKDDTQPPLPGNTFPVPPGRP